jgi:apolipoprotein N-acyltransferase
MLRAFLTPILGGILFGCCFLPAPAHWLVWICLVPIAAAISARRHIVATYVGMYCAGLLFNLITTDWIRTLEGGTGMLGRSAPDWLIQAQLLALFWPLALFLGRLLVGNWALPMSLALPAAWTVHEFLLRRLWALIDATGWHIYLLGYAMVDHHYMSQIADLGGVSALSFVGACSSGAIWDLASLYRSPAGDQSRRPSYVGATFAASILLASLGYGVWALHRSSPSEGPTVWLMPDRLLQEPLAELPWRPDTPGAPDILLWSELSYHGPAVHSARVSEEGQTGDSPANVPVDPRSIKSEESLVALCRSFDVPLVVGYTRSERDDSGQKSYNSAAFVDPRNGLQGSYDKVGLVPWTEFTPWNGLSTRKGAQFDHGTAYPVFTLRSSNGQGSYRFAVAICYDVAFPSVFRRFMQAADGPPDFFLVCSSERSDKTGRMSRCALAMARVRAIECRRAIARNVHLGHSGTIDSCGELHEASLPSLIQSPTSLGAIPLDQRSTLSVLCGDWIPSAIIGLVLIAFAAKAVARRASRRMTAATVV